MNSHALFLLFTLASVSFARPWAGPEQTGAATTTANWSPAPTSNTKKDESFLELIRRDIFPVSVCGWIGGNSAEPAYCSTSSSCVWNSDYSIVGCCATASSACQFYTACVDMNSPKQTGDSDNVYTCRGTSVCYSNTYPDSYTQWGCGSSNWATFVATSYAGMGPSLQIVITGSDSSPASSTVKPPSITAIKSSSVKSTPVATTPSKSSTKEAASSSSESGNANSSPTNPASTNSDSANSTPTATSDAGTVVHKSTTPIGAIVGGIVGGIVIIALIATICLLGRKKRWFNKNNFHRTSSIQPDSPPMYSTTHLNATPVGRDIPHQGLKSEHTTPAAALAFDEKGLPITQTKEKSAGTKKVGGVGGAAVAGVKKPSGTKRPAGVEKKQRAPL